MFPSLQHALSSQNPLERATIVKSFKHAASKETDSRELEKAVEVLLDAVRSPDIQVKRHALESLNSIVHNQPQTVRSELERLHKSTIAETVIRPDLITEVDLGPFKHKVDEGIPIRKAAYGLLDTMVEKMPERADCGHITEIAIKGLDDSAEECMIICLHLLGRLISWQPNIVISSLEHLLESFEKQLQKNLKLVASQQSSSEKAHNILRALLRVVEQLQRTPELSDSGQAQRFSDFLKIFVYDNPIAKDMLKLIAATASQAIGGDHFF